MLKWRVYYGDGTVADNHSHSLATLPRWNVQLICQHDAKHNRSLAKARDYYIYRTDDEHWYPLDFVGLIDYMAHDLGIVGAVLFGRYVSNEQYDDLEKRASADTDFLPESAASPRFQR